MSVWLLVAPHCLPGTCARLNGSVPHPTQGRKDEAPIPAPKPGVHVDPSQDARPCILGSVWEESSLCPQVKFFFVWGPPNGNPLLQLNCITMPLFIRHPQK